jgi:hypothetical protein
MEWDPAFRVEVVSFACPDPLRETVPRVVAPSLNVTNPVGMPEVREDTVAVKVTVWLGREGLAEDTSEVDVPACVTLWVIGGAVCGLKLLSPE